MKIAQGLKAQARLAQKGLLVATVLVSLLAASKAVAASEFESGSARNGAGRSGVSIPVEVDGMLTVDQFNTGMLYCKREVTRDLLSQILRQEVKDVTYSVKFPSAAIFSLGRVRADLWVYIPIHGNKETPTFAFNYGAQFNPYDAPRIAEYQVDPRVTDLVSNAQKSEAKFFGGLEVVYETQKDSGYDELGTFSPGKMLIRKFIITDGPVSRQVFNQFTGSFERRPVSLKLLSAEDFKTCLQDNFGR